MGTFILVVALLSVVLLAFLLKPLLFTPASNPLPARYSAVLLALLIPLVATAFYLLLGSPAMLDSKAVAALGSASNPPGNKQGATSALRPGQQVTPQTIQNMLQRLEERLAKNPDDAKGWLMLGRSYHTLERNAEALEAFEKGESAIGNDVNSMLAYAEALAIRKDANGKRSGFKGKAGKLLERAIALQPDNPEVLMLSGAAAMQDKRYNDAIAYWQKLLPMLPAESEIADMLRAGINNAQRAAGAEDDEN